MNANPLKRLSGLLTLDRKDIVQIFIYAMLAGLVSLSLPLGIQAIVNLIQAGTVTTSWIVLVIVVIFGVALVGLLSMMQLRITEHLQQKIFVRSSFEFSYRLPKLTFESTYGHYPPELANRFFDTLTIQKGISKLLLDFSSALLQIVFGIILLSLYHSFFIFFGILLIALLFSIFRFSYNSGLSTSLNESFYKYKVAGWLQEVARNSVSFKRRDHFEFAQQKNNRLVEEYVGHREKHFSVIKSQFLQLVAFKVIITASLLLVGGYLVLDQQMTIGQFVGAEIIILLVINSVEKIILGLEAFYDVLTAVEKIGHIVDLKTENPNGSPEKVCYAKISLQLENASFRFPDSPEVLHNVTLTIKPGEKIFLEGDNGAGKTTLLRVLSGLLEPTSGSFYINDDMFRKMDIAQYRSQTAVLVHDETPFEGTVAENIAFDNDSISYEMMAEAISRVHLGEFVKTLPNGLDTNIAPDGIKLSSSNAQKILMARTIASNPMVIFCEDPLDKVDEATAREIIDFIMAPTQPWSVVVTSKNNYWKSKCSRVITLKQGCVFADKTI